MASRVKTNYTGVYLRDNKIYEITYQNNGKTKWETLGPKGVQIGDEKLNAKRASEIRAQKIMALKHPDLDIIPKDEMTVEQAFDEYVKLKNLSPDTIKNNRYVLNVHYKDIMKLGLSKVEPLMIANKVAAWRKEESDKGKKRKAAENTISYRVSTLKKIFNYMIEMDVFKGTNPVKSKRFDLKTVPREGFYTWSEGKKLLDYLLKLKCIEAYAQCALALYQGARAVEVRRLKTEDIDFINMKITLTGKGNRFVKGPKATIPLLPFVANILKLIPMEIGKPVFKNFKRREIQRAIYTLGLNQGVEFPSPRYRAFHTMRHSFATYLASLGIPLLIVSQLLRHKASKEVAELKLNVTQIYTHVMNGAPESAMRVFSEKVDALMRGEDVDVDVELVKLPEEISK